MLFKFEFKRASSLGIAIIVNEVLFDGPLEVGLIDLRPRGVQVIQSDMQLGGESLNVVVLLILTLVDLHGGLPRYNLLLDEV